MGMVVNVKEIDRWGCKYKLALALLTVLKGGNAKMSAGIFGGALWGVCFYGCIYVISWRQRQWVAFALVAVMVEMTGGGGLVSLICQ